MARYKPGHREESRKRILDAAGKGFRMGGYGGIGVDGLAKAAGVTSGAFYGHFASKAEAFHAAVEAGLDELREGIERFRRDHGPDWLERFVDFYLDAKRRCDLADACALPTLSPEVVRSDDGARSTYADALDRVVGAVAEGLDPADPIAAKPRALSLLSLLSGGVTMARAVPDETHALEIVSAVKAAALVLAGERGPTRSDRQPGRANRPVS